MAMRNIALVAVVSSGFLMAACGGSGSSGWNGPPETFRVNLTELTSLPRGLYDIRAGGPVKEDGKIVGMAYITCQSTALDPAAFCTAIMHLRQGDLTAMDVTAFHGNETENLRLVSGTGIYRDPVGWLSPELLPENPDVHRFGEIWRVVLKPRAPMEGQPRV